MIQPFYHVTEQGERAVQVMVVGPRDKSKPHMEGTPPLYDGYLNLSYFPDSPANSYRAQVRIDNGDWENVPEMVGRINDAFTPGYLTDYFSAQGKTQAGYKRRNCGEAALSRIQPKLISRDLAREVSAYTARAIRAGDKTIKGKVTIAPRRVPAEHRW